jgi:hypothetical protein
LATFSGTFIAEIVADGAIRTVSSKMADNSAMRSPIGTLPSLKSTTPDLEVDPPIKEP